jgi:hypothetical protein
MTHFRDRSNIDEMIEYFIEILPSESVRWQALIHWK